jgi:transcriptional regulator with XRE-family HTH domain
MMNASNPEWGAEAVHALGKRVAAARERRGLTVQQLSERIAELGAPIGRVTLAKLENGLRHSVTPYEVIAMAAALQVSPLELIWPIGYDARLEILPGVKLPPLEAVNWFCGGMTLELSPDGAHTNAPRTTEVTNVGLLRVHDSLVSRIELRRSELDAARRDAAAEPDNEQARWSLETAEKNLNEWTEFVTDQLLLYRAQMSERGMALPPVPDHLKFPEEMS